VIDGIDFSERGQAPTAFEVDQLRKANPMAPYIHVAHRLMRDLGDVAGAQAFAILLDELGGEKAKLPVRHRFFRRLWRCERDELILTLHTRPDWTPTDIGKLLGVSRATVSAVVRTGGAAVAVSR